MRKIALVILVFTLIGCAEMQLSSEAQRVVPVSGGTTGCQFIKDIYIETYPEALTYTLQWYTYNAGGDAYKIISQVPSTRGLGAFAETFYNENAMTIHFEIFKCKP